MKYIKRFYENKNIEVVCNEYGIENWSIVDGKINVDGSVDLSYENLSSLDIFDGISFGEVSGNFSCPYNRLTSLEGAPSKVGGSFNSRNNQLESLEGAPTKVNGNFNCEYNMLNSLEYGPSYVGGDYDCAHNKLISLQYAPIEVGRNFHCGHNKLTSLKYVPSLITGVFECRFNNILNFDFFPYVGDSLYLNTQLEYLFNNYIKSKDKIELFNSYGILNGNKINLTRLKKFADSYCDGVEIDTNWFKRFGYIF